MEFTDKKVPIVPDVPVVPEFRKTTGTFGTTGTIGTVSVISTEAGNSSLIWLNALVFWPITERI
jgi:hypothetical protein